MMFFGSRATSRAVKALLIANLAVFMLQIIPWTGMLLAAWGPLVPIHTFENGQLWRLVSYMFMHDTASFFHILFNMLVLWMFGVEIENLWGSRRFTWFYLICGIGSGLFSIINLFNPSMRFVSVIGASGAVLGLLTIYAYYFPQRQVLLFFVLPVNIRLVIVGYALYSLFGTLRPGRDVISHLTHLGGIVIAVAYIKLYPSVSGWLHGVYLIWRERESRNRVETEDERKRFFADKIDPILDKIGKQGMESLTKEERDLLKQASKTDRERLKSRKILPLDLFK